MFMFSGAVHRPHNCVYIPVALMHGHSRGWMSIHWNNSTLLKKMKVTFRPYFCLCEVLVVVDLNLTF